MIPLFLCLLNLESITPAVTRYNAALSNRFTAKNTSIKRATLLGTRVYPRNAPLSIQRINPKKRWKPASRC